MSGFYFSFMRLLKFWAFKNCLWKCENADFNEERSLWQLKWFNPAEWMMILNLHSLLASLEKGTLPSEFQLHSKCAQGEPVVAAFESSAGSPRGGRVVTIAAAEEFLHGASKAVVLSELGSITTLKEERRIVTLKASLGGQYVCALRSWLPLARV